MHIHPIHTRTTRAHTHNHTHTDMCSYTHIHTHTYTHTLRHTRTTCAHTCTPTTLRPHSHTLLVAAAAAGDADAAAENGRYNIHGSNINAAAAGRDFDDARPSSETLSVLEPQQHLQLTKLRSHFHKDVRKQLYSESDDRLFFDNLKVCVCVCVRVCVRACVCACAHLQA